MRQLMPGSTRLRDVQCMLPSGLSEVGHVGGSHFFYYLVCQCALRAARRATWTLSLEGGVSQF